jgi:hypothetical protein
MKTISVGLLTLLSASVLAADGTVTIVTRQDCSRVTIHRPSADVQYQPGVDVYGRSVAPADLGGSSITIPDQIDINIGIKLDEKYGLGSGGFYSSDASIGKVTVKDGAMYWNGKRMDEGDQHALAEACRRAFPR